MWSFFVGRLFARTETVNWIPRRVVKSLSYSHLEGGTSATCCCTRFSFRGSFFFFKSTDFQINSTDEKWLNVLSEKKRTIMYQSSFFCLQFVLIFRALPNMKITEMLKNFKILYQLTKKKNNTKHILDLNVREKKANINFFYECRVRSFCGDDHRILASIYPLFFYLIIFFEFFLVDFVCNENSFVAWQNWRLERFIS